MYLDFFGLKEKPFSLTPDPRFLFLSESHRQALDHMLYGIREREGFILIVGDIGTGKTTICRELLEKLDPGSASALILNPLLSETELLEAILQDFGILPSPHAPEARQEEYRRLYETLDPETQTALELNPMLPANKVLQDILSKVEKPAVQPSKKELIDRLNAWLLERASQGGNAVLIIDEAQNLSSPVLEQIRILSNLETPRQKLLQIVLVGQLELKRKLEGPALRQLNQRISVRYQIKPMTVEETKRYVEHRLFVAGSNAAVTFGDDAYGAIYDYSRGVPRLINVISERSMLGAYVDQTRRVDRELVERCRRSLESNLDEEAEIVRSISSPDETPAVVNHVAAAPAAATSPRQGAPVFEMEETPEEAVKQPWERKKASGSGGMRKIIVAALVLLTLLLAAAFGYRFYMQKNTPAASKPSAAGQEKTAPQAREPAAQSAAPAQSQTAAATEAASAQAGQGQATDAAVQLSYSIQLGAFQSLDDGLDQMRLLTEQGLSGQMYVVPLHLVQLGGRWYRLFLGGYPDADAARSELMRLVEQGTVSSGSARIVQTPLAFKLGDYDSQAGAEKDRQDYLSRFSIPSYAFELHGSTPAVYRLYAGAFEEKAQAAFLADRLEESGLHGELVERTGLWKTAR
ncbi:AAA family ATPase [bacterium]|nr:AAA family ATPase [bacterium]